MKNIYIIISTFLLINLAFTLISCGNGEDEKIRQEKVELRQEFDSAMLSIDKELEELYETLNVRNEDTLAIKNTIDDLKELRNDFEKQSDNLEQVQSNNWKDFKTESDSLLKRHDRIIDAINMEFKNVEQINPVYR